jgi:hypothetical protein
MAGNSTATTAAKPKGDGGERPLPGEIVANSHAATAVAVCTSKRPRLTDAGTHNRRNSEDARIVAGVFVSALTFPKFSF